MSFDFSTLITDRSQDDVSSLFALLAKKLETWTPEELDAFNSGMLKGGYCWADLNRVTACMQYLDEELRKAGYESGYIPVLAHPESLPMHDKNTLLLLHGEDLIDSSIYKVPLTNNGVQVSSDQSKFGGKSLYFNGASALLFPPSTIVYGDRDFTIDWWEYCTGTNGMTRYSTMYDGSSGMSVGYAGTDLYMARNSAWDMLALTKTAFSVTVNQWVHWALVRNGNSVKTYRNGVQFASATVSGAVQAVTSQMCIGAHGGGNYQYFHGYIDEFRISDIARWTADFTPPSEPYNVVSQPTPGLDPYTWYKDDKPTITQLNQYLSNVEKIRSTLSAIPNNPDAPTTPDELNVTAANNIEKILLNVNSMLENMKRTVNLGWALGIADIGIYGGL